MSWKHTRRSTYEIASIHPETGLNDGVRAISVDEWRCTCVFVSMRNEIAIVCLVTSCIWRHKLMFMCGMYHSLFGCFRCFFFSTALDQAHLSSTHYYLVAWGWFFVYIFRVSMWVVLCENRFSSNFYHLTSGVSLYVSHFTGECTTFVCDVHRFKAEREHGCSPAIQWKILNNEQFLLSGWKFIMYKPIWNTYHYMYITYNSYVHCLLHMPIKYRNKSTLNPWFIK